MKKSKKLNSNYILKIQKISKSNSIEIGTIEELKARYEH